MFCVMLTCAMGVVHFFVFVFAIECELFSHHTSCVFFSKKNWPTYGFQGQPYMSLLSVEKITHLWKGLPVCAKGLPLLFRGVPF